MGKTSFSYRQTHLWCINQNTKGNYNRDALYNNVPLLIRIHGVIDKDILLKCIIDVVGKYDILSSCLINEVLTTGAEENESVLECIYEKRSFKVIKQAIEFAIDKSRIPFEFEKTIHPLQINLLEWNTNEFLLFIIFHNIVIDRESLKIIYELFIKHIEFLSGITDKVVTPPTIQYKDFLQWQYSLPEDLLESQVFYWRSKLQGKTNNLELPSGQLIFADEYISETFNFRIDKDIYSKLLDYITEVKVSHFTVLSAFFKILIFKYTGEKDIVIGTHASNRPDDACLDIVGPIANLIAIRSNISFNDRVSTYITNVENLYREALENQFYPFDKLIKDLDNKEPLFDILFNVDIIPAQNKQINNVEYSVIECNLGFGKHDLNIFLQKNGTYLEGVITYNSSKIHSVVIENLVKHYKELITAFVKQPDITIGQIKYQTVNYEQLINNTAVSVNNNIETLVSLWFEQVNQHPTREAVNYKHLILTYRELEELSNTICSELLENYNLEPGSFVAILMSNSELLIATILAVLKCGAVYVPIDSDIPSERIKYILEDVACSVVIVDETTFNYARTFISNISILNVYKIRNTRLKKTLYLPKIKPDDNAYVIYTSGTTGKPKGCLVTHQNVVSLLSNLHVDLGTTPEDVWLLAHSYSFDFSIAEIFGAVLFGCKLIIPDRKLDKDVNSMYEVFVKNKVTILTQTPMSFKTLIEIECQQTTHKLNEFLRIVLLGGEKLKFSSLQKWIKFYSTDNIRIINGYGPTETTVFVTFYDLNDIGINMNRASIIGKPLAGITAYVLDDNLNQQPIAVAGELYIGGNGVTLGYINNPYTTMERFISFGEGRTSTRLYKTGDVVCLNADGNIEYIGRSDEQVKINGYRIELEEIEVCLKKFQGVKEVVVKALSDEAENKYIVAYYLADNIIEESTLKDYLKTMLPSYMVPVRYVKLEYIPLTNNGKTNRSALPYVNPMSELSGTKSTRKIDHEIEAIFREVLKIQNIEIYIENDFFDLGGNSLSAIILLLKIESLYGVKLTLQELFDNSKLEQLSNILISKPEKAPSQLTPFLKIPEAPYYPTSSSQERVFVLQQLTPDDTFYNITQSLEVHGDLDATTVKKVVLELVQRHEVLRTSFELIDNNPVQIIHPTIDFNIQEYDASENDIESIVKPFDLTKVPLFRVAFIKEQSGSLKLLFDIHHIILDYLSQGILIKEFITLLAGEKLKSLKYQYKDYAVWQRNNLKRVGLSVTEYYWHKKFEDGVQRIELPYDFTGYSNISYEGREHVFLLSNETTQSLRNIANSEGVTLYMLLLATFSVFISKLSGEKSIKVGTPVLGRNHPELLELLGFFTNTIIISNRLSKGETFQSFLKRVKQECITSFDNQDYPFELLVEKVSVNNNIGNNPLFNVMYSFKEQIDNKDNDLLKKLNNDGIVFTKNEYIKKKSLFDLSLHITDVGEQLSFTFEYKTTLFKQSTLVRFSELLKNIIKEVIADITQNIDNIQLLDKSAIDNYLELSKGRDLKYKKGTFLSLFESNVFDKLTSIALCQDGQELSYEDLNNRANQLAKYLINTICIKSGDLIALFHDRTPNVIVSILAIMKTGAAYVPIDPSLPMERVNVILNDANIKVLITQQKYVEVIPGNITTVVPDNIIKENIFEPNPDINVQPHMLAYVIYTSGSTGTPKGVVVSHRSLYNYINWLNILFPVSAKNGVLASATLSFDMSISEIFYPLAFGGTTYLVDSLLDISRLKAIHNKITFIVSVPSVISTLLEYINGFESLDVVGLGGETIDIRVLKKIRSYTKAKVYNLYGPTEATVAPAYFNCNTVQENETEVSIGLPIPNSKILVLDDAMNVQPPNVRGELYIGGIALANGYLNKPELTSEKFLPNPYDKSEMLYRTGDFGYYRTDGKLFYNGRIDEQVKIRGYRVELHEVVLCMKSIVGVSDVVVLAKGDKGNSKYLCSYYVSDSNINVDTIKQKLNEKLPSYMVPSEYHRLDKIPLKVNGKVNMQLLMSMEMIEESDIGPVDNIQEFSEVEEILLCGIKEYLPKNSINVNVSFFEMGMNSLMLLKIVSYISINHNMDIPPIDFFKYPTIKLLGEHIAGGVSKEKSDILEDDHALLKDVIKLFEHGDT